MAVVAVALLLAACGGAPPSGADDTLRVVTTTTVFADLVEQVGGPDVTVHSLVPKGGEVHTFDPTPRGFEQVARAELLVANGLGLDDWLVKVASDTGTTAPVVKLADGVPADRLLGAEDGTPNPHLWLDVELARLYVAHIADALATADPVHAGRYRERAAAYDQRLVTLDATIRDQLATVPQENARSSRSTTRSRTSRMRTAWRSWARSSMRPARTRAPARSRARRRGQGQRRRGGHRRGAVQRRPRPDPCR